MKKLIVLCTIAPILILLPLTACLPSDDKTSSTTPIPTTSVPIPTTSVPIPTTSVPPATGEEAPDDIMGTPGGWAYRANVHQEGVENPWPPVESIKVFLNDSDNAPYLTYRDYIETRAGETRNNIFRVTTPDWDIQNLNLYASDVPSGIEIAERGRWHGPRTIAPVLIIAISQDTQPGEYNFEIKLEIDGKDYGSVPCIIKIVE